MPPLSQHLSHESTATLHTPSTSVFGFNLKAEIFPAKVHSALGTDWLYTG